MVERQRIGAVHNQRQLRKQAACFFVYSLLARVVFVYLNIFFLSVPDHVFSDDCACFGGSVCDCLSR